MTSNIKSDLLSTHHPLSISDLLKKHPINQETSFVQQVFTLLWDSIVSIELKPGQMISEKEVAEALNISKTPIREALIRLEDVGLVKIVPKSGTYVTPISISRYLDACFTRLHLEIGAVRRATSVDNRMDCVAQMDEIITAQKAALDAKNDLNFFRLDEALHKSFFESAQVSSVWQVVKRAQADMYRVRHVKRLHNIRREQAVIEEHMAIVNAIRTGNPDEAEVALVSHLGSLEKEVETLSANFGLLSYIEALNAVRPKGRVARQS